MQHRMPLFRPPMSGIAWALTRGWQPVGVSIGEAPRLSSARLAAAARHGRRPKRLNVAQGRPGKTGKYGSTALAGAGKAGRVPLRMNGRSEYVVATTDPLLAAAPRTLWKSQAR